MNPVSVTVNPGQRLVKTLNGFTYTYVGGDVTTVYAFDLPYLVRDGVVTAN